jgi:hypothetical protein
MRFAPMFSIVITIATCAFAQTADKPQSLAEGPTIPVLAWGGVPYDKATPERYAELAGAGFTHNYSGANNAETMQKILDLAHAQGLKQMISLPELERDPEATAKQFKDHPANGGYYLRDEPGANLFAELSKWTQRIQSVDKTNPCYINLLPTYGIPEQWQTPTYSAYVDRFIAEVPVPMLSWDHYCVIGEDGKDSQHYLRPDYYQNLEICAAAARKAGRPLWAFGLSTAHSPYPIPSIAHLRLQAFSNLAYGTQVMQYFTYWTTKSDTWNFHAGPIDTDGKRTPTYDRVKQANAEMQALRGAFVGSRVIAVFHTGKTLPAGTTRYSPADPVKFLETEGTGAVVSLLEKDKQRFLVIVNRDIVNPMPLRVSFDAKAGVNVAGRDGSLKAASADYTATSEPGDVTVFAWTVGN